MHSIGQSIKQNNVHTNTVSVQCISTVYSICPYKCNQWPYRLVEKSNSLISNVGRGKWNWQHSMAHPRKPLYRRKKNLAKIFYASRVIAHFVPNFVAMATGSVGGKCNWQHSMAHLRKPPYRCKNLRIISYASRVIANFVPNFVAMATGVGRGKMQLAAFDGPSPKTLL